MARAEAGRVDAALARVLRASLEGYSPSADGLASTHLAALQRELQEEERDREHGEDRKVLLSQENADRALFAALESGPPDGSPSPLAYCARVHERASSEERALSSSSSAVLSALSSAKLLAAQHAVLSLQPELAQSFNHPNPNQSLHRGSLQLSDALLNGSLPPGFFEDLAEAAVRSEGTEDDPQSSTLNEAISGFAYDVWRSTQSKSLLADFTTELNACCRVARNHRAADAFTRARCWDPQAVADAECFNRQMSARQLEVESLLGQYLKMSPLPDVLGNGKPDVQSECFSESAMNRPREVEANRQMLRTSQAQLHEGLTSLVHTLLKHGGFVRERTKALLARFVDKNWERSKMQSNPLQAGTNGAAINLCGVLLRLCGPFLDRSSGKMHKIEASYSYNRGSRLPCLQSASRLVASEAEVASWAEDEAAGEYGFICECFWMTVVCMHIGVVKCIHEVESYATEVSRQQQALREFDNSASPDEARQTEELRRQVAKGRAVQVAFETSLLEPRLLADSMAFFRLECTWLLALAQPSLMTQGGQLTLPLEEPCSRGFAALPEILIEDIGDFLTFTTSVSPATVETEGVESFFDFVVTFIGSPSHVRNPHMRSKLADVLRAFKPPSNPGEQPNSRVIADMFMAHSLAVEHLVPNLIQLYVDIEHTDSEFYQRFTVRHTLSSVLEYLWSLTGTHKQRWERLSREDPELYKRFVNMIINDSIYLLDESFKKLPEVKRLEGELEQEGESSEQQQQGGGRRDRRRELTRNQQIIRTQFTLADANVRMMSFTSEDLPQTFLVPEMVERVGAMLNYFLQALAGEQRKQLAVKDQQKYNFRPKELLRQLLAIYVNLYKGAPERFARAVAADERSFSMPVLQEACRLARNFLLLSESHFRGLEEMMKQAKSCAEEEAAMQEDLSDAPDEFLDPVTFAIMSDPVTLPSGHVIDKPTIQRHLLSDETDPFSRQPLTNDMLEPNSSLKQRIQMYLAGKRASAREEVQQRVER
jgi:ubiquitin conjugation factor E4 B